LRRLCPLALLLSGSAALAANAPAWNSPIAAVLDGTLKPTPGSYPAPFRSSIALWTAKNEFEAFHLVLFGPNQGVSIALPTLVQVGGTVQIPAAEVRIFEEQPISFTQPSSIEGVAGAWPDALVPYGPQTEVGLKQVNGTWQEVVTTEVRRSFPVSVGGGSTRSFLVEIHIPANAQSGLYRGQVVVTRSSSRTNTQTIPVELHVRSFALPSTATLRSNLRMGIDEICRAHGDISGLWCPDQVAFRRWARLYGRFLLDHRLSSYLSDALVSAADGSPDYATSLSNFVTAYGPLIDGNDPYSRLVGARMTAIAYPYFRDTDVDGVSQAKLQAWATFARGNGDWFQRTIFYTRGEPDWTNGWSPAIHWANLAHAADPGFKVLLTSPIDSYASNAGLTSGVANVIAPVLDDLDNRSPPHYGNQRPNYDSFLAFDASNELWAYQSCDSHSCTSTSDPTVYGWPSVMVDGSAVQARAEPWMHYIYGVSGLHYWDSVYRLSKAWDTDGSTDFTGNGEGTVLYPGTPTPIPGGSSQGIGGTTHVPLASNRLKFFRDGLEDYEYLKLCEGAQGTGMATSLARSLFPMVPTPGAGPANETGSMYSATNWNPSTGSADPAKLAASLAARREDLARCAGGPSDAVPIPFPAFATRQLGTPGEEDSAQAAVAPDGSSYVAGSTTGAVIGAGAGGKDVAVWKLDGALGVTAWAQFGTAGDDIPRALATSTTGDLYLLGTTTGVLGAASLGGRDAFLAKLGPTGARSWTAQFGTSSADEASGLAVDSSGNAWVVYRTPSRGKSTFVQFDAAGTQRLSIGLGGNSVSANAVAVDGTGNVYVGGTSGSNGSGAFVSKYSPAGALLWTRRPFTGTVTALTLDADGSLYAAGVVVDLPAGNDRPALSRYDTSGKQGWTATLGGTSDFGYVSALARGPDPAAGSTKLYLAGYQLTQIVGDPVQGKDAFVVQFETSGNQGWAQTVRTSGDDAFSGIAAWGAAGGVLLAGTTTGNVAGSHGGADLLVQVLQPLPP
jgi:hypothetical protein